MPKTSTGSRRYLFTDCHDDDSGYIYFTLVSPNGSLALDSEGRRALHYIGLDWHLTYIVDLHKALFNDPKPQHRCPKGNCFSTTIPGTDLRLEHVRDPEIFRSGWYPGQCGYLDGIQKIAKPDISLGDFGYLFAGAAPQIPVVNFLEQQVEATYPALETGLIVGVGVGVFLIVVMGLPFAAFIFFKVRSGCRKTSAGTKQMGKRFTIASQKVVMSVSNVANKCREKMGNVLWKTRDGRRKQQNRTQDNTVSEHQSTYLVDAVAPPAYSSREPSRVFVDIELEGVPAH